MKKKHQARRRCERLARQLVIHGKRLAGSDEDFIGGIRKPAAMSQNDMVATYNWATSTPQRWHFTAMAYFKDERGNQYSEERVGVTGQHWLVNDLSEWRMGLLQDAINAGNHKHLVAEGFEYRLARKEDFE